MPHCQKEKHNHASKSKKEKQHKREEGIARRKAFKAAEEAAELERQNGGIGGNNVALKEGYGEYEIGREEEMEYVAKFNMNKRSKKVRLFVLYEYTYIMNGCIGVEICILHRCIRYVCMCVWCSCIAKKLSYTYISYC